MVSSLNAPFMSTSKVEVIVFILARTNTREWAKGKSVVRIPSKTACCEIVTGT